MYVLDANNYYEFFLMILFPAESATKNIYLTCETICILKGPHSTDSRGFENVARTIEINFAFLNSLDNIHFINIGNTLICLKIDSLGERRTSTHLK